jgi:opacity protein-like surface antigen
MKNAILATCTTIALTLAASAAIADDGRYYDYNNGYMGSDYSGSYRSDNGYGYRHDIVSPQWVVRDLRQQGFRDISRPYLAGRMYQVHARDPNGQYVKVYVDAYSGQIARVKG